MNKKNEQPRPGFIAVVRTGIGYVWTLLSVALFITIAALALIVDRRQRVHDLFSVWWARGILATVGVGYTLNGQEHITRDERFVIVANHQSMLDIPVLLSTIQPRNSVRFVAKRSLFSVPILGWGMRIFDHLPVDPKSMRGSYRGLQQAQQSLKFGRSVIIFPEATRSENGRMKPFHSSAFHIAARAGIRILPITVTGGIVAMPKDRLVAAPGTVMHVQVHPPMAVSGTTAEAIQRTTRACQAVIEQGLPPELRSEA